MSDFETWKMIWRENSWNPAQQNKVIDAVCERGDPEALKWFWTESLWNTSYRTKIIDAVCERGDPEALKWFWTESLWNTSYRVKLEESLLQKNNVAPNQSPLSPLPIRTVFQYHAFICHASEDKENFVTPLAVQLANKGVKVWYDKFTLKMGDSLRQKIDEGLKNSRYGIVVLSKAFFRKNWPKWELDGLFSREVKGKKVILPIWHGVSKDEVASYSPILSGKYAALSSDGLEKVVDAILEVINV